MKREIEAIAHGWAGTCGIGSLPENTKAAKKALSEAIDHIGAKTINDAGCGDMQFRVEGYQGYDFIPWVDDVIKLDYTKKPMRKADLIFCRFSLIHLDRFDVIKALKLFRRSKYLLATCYPRIRDQPVYSVHGTMWNLSLPPFDLGQPIKTWPDYKSELALWRM